MSDNSNNKVNDRVKSEQGLVNRITNNDLVCKDCAFVFDDSKVMGNTSRCSKYSMKPGYVLAGGDCDLKVEKS